MADIYTAVGWFWMPSQQVDDCLANNISWPFTNITKEEFDVLHKSMADRNAPNTFLHIYATAISAVGIFFTILLLGSLRQKAVVEKNSFYIAMTIVALTDLAFHFFSLVHFIWYKVYKIFGSSDFLGMYILTANKGLMYTMSLASDMCAVVLTCERYLAIGKPHLHKKLADNYRKITRPVVCLIVIVVAATRMHYSIDKKVISEGSLYFYTSTEFASTSFMTGLVMISDIILPVLLLLTMVFLSTLFRLAVTKRRKSKKSAVATFSKRIDQGVLFIKQSRIAPDSVQPCANSENTKATAQGPQSIIALTLALDSLFLLNQLGYCLYFAAEFLLTSHQITYESNFEEFNTWVTLNRWEAYADTGSALAECVSHALNFPLYIALSGSMRRDFREFVKKICKC